MAEGVIPVADAFVANKETEIGIGGVGTVTFDATATAKIKSNADDEGSTNVFFKVEDVTETKPVQNANLVYEVTMKTVDEKGVEVFKEGKAEGVATVTVPLGEEVEDVTSVALVNDSGTIIEGGVVPDSDHFENGILTFQVNHFSKYAIKYTVKGGEVDYVAQIGSRKYTTLAKAVEAAQTGNTVTLIKDVVLDKPIETNKTFTLTLNANITPVSGWQTNSNTTDALVIIRRGGNITINGTGKISSDNIANAYAAVKLTNKDEADTGAAAKLTVDGDVTLEGYYYGIVGNGSRQNTEITINGGTIKGTAANDNIGIYHPQAGSLTINGGIIEGSTGIALKGGKLVVNDGTIIGNGVSATFLHHGSGWNNTGDALAVEVCDYPGQNPPQTDLSAEIKGGKFASTNGKPVASYVQPDKSYTPLAGFISGGIYSKQPAAELIPFGYHIEANTDSQTKTEYPYTVAPRYPLSIEYPEGVINGYPTIQEALTAAVAFGTQNPDLIPEIHISEDISVSPTHASENYGAIHMVDYGIQNIKGVLIDGTNSESGKSKIIYSPAQNSTYKASGIIKASSGAHVILKNIEFAFTGELIDMANYCIDIVDATVDLYNVKLVDGSYNRIQLNASTNSTAACYNFYEGEYSLNGTIEGKTECFKTWGGTFDTDPSLFLPSEAYVTYKEDNKYKVCLATEAPSYTASLISNSKTTNYAGTSGPAAALADAKSGDTVTLLSGTLNTGKNLSALGNTLTIVQNGGTYTGTVTTDASGCVVNAETESNTTVYTVVSDPDADKVAQIGDTKYSTVKDALTALNADGKTVTLLKDVTSFIPSYLSKSYNVTFNFNGKKICTTELFKNYNVSSKTVTITGDGIVESDVNGNLALISFYENGAPIYIFENGKYTVKNPLENNYVLSEKVSGTFNFNGGIFTGNVLAQYGTLNFSGAEFNGNLIIGAYDAKKTVNVNISGGIIDGNINIRPDSDGDYWKQATSTLNISGGVIEGVITKQDADNFVINISISGGKFKVKPDASYLASGATCSDTPDEDGYYVVTSSN